MADGGLRLGQQLKDIHKENAFDYPEIFSPIVKLTTIRILLSIVASENLHFEQIDVKTVG